MLPSGIPMGTNIGIYWETHLKHMWNTHEYIEHKSAISEDISRFQFFFRMAQNVATPPKIGVLLENEHSICVRLHSWQRSICFFDNITRTIHVQYIYWHLPKKWRDQEKTRNSKVNSLYLTFQCLSLCPVYIYIYLLKHLNLTETLSKHCR